MQLAFILAFTLPFILARFICAFLHWVDYQLKVYEARCPAVKAAGLFLFSNTTAV